MENKKPKFNRLYLKTWKLSKAFSLIFIFYYLIENYAFAIMYGWHWTAQTDIEKRFDMIGGILADIPLVFFLITAVGVIDYLMEPSDK